MPITISGRTRYWMTLASAVLLGLLLYFGSQPISWLSEPTGIRQRATAGISSCRVEPSYGRGGRKIDTLIVLQLTSPPYSVRYRGPNHIADRFAVACERRAMLDLIYEGVHHGPSRELIYWVREAYVSPTGTPLVSEEDVARQEQLDEYAWIALWLFIVGTVVYSAYKLINHGATASPR